MSFIASKFNPSMETREKHAAYQFVIALWPGVVSVKLYYLCDKKPSKLLSVIGNEKFYSTNCRPKLDNL